MKQKVFVTFVLLLAMLTSKSQTNEVFKPEGSPFMRIYTNFHTTYSDGESQSAFELTRVYLGYKYQFSKEISAKANIDVGDPNDGGDFQLTAFIKNAYMAYKKEKLEVNFGMISTNSFGIQEDFWGYRYLAKSLQDEHSFNSSADLGMSVSYQFNDVLAADMIVANGEGYKRVQGDSTLRTGFGVTLTPSKEWIVRSYYDFSKKVETQTSLATFVGFQNKKVSVGAEYNYMTNYKFVADRDRTGTSFYVTVFAAPKLKFFARYDNLMSGSDWNLSKDGEQYIAGIEYSPVKGIKIAPNFSGWNPADDSKPFNSTLILNCEFRF